MAEVEEMSDVIDAILNNTYFHLVAVISIAGAFIYAEIRFRQLMRAITGEKQ